MSSVTYTENLEDRAESPTIRPQLKKIFKIQKAYRKEVYNIPAEDIAYVRETVMSLFKASVKEESSVPESLIKQEVIEDKPKLEGPSTMKPYNTVVKRWTPVEVGRLLFCLW
jgi:hypothetical protein